MSKGDVLLFRTNSLNERYARAGIVLLAIIGVLLLAHVLYENRLRYQQMAFNDYFAWWDQFNRGINTWRHGCNYTPFFIVLFAPLAHLGPRPAYWTWQSMQLAGLVAALGLSFVELERNVAAKRAIGLGTIVVLSPYILFGTLYESEPTTILLALLIAAWVLSRHRRPALAGLMLAAATLMKVYPAAAGGYFLFRRRFDAIAWSTLWCAVGILLTGPTLWHESLFSGALPYFAAPEWAYDERALALLLKAYSAGAALGLTAFDQTIFAVPTYCLLSLCVIASGAYATWRCAEAAEVDGTCFSLWLVAALLVSPIAWNHELTLTLPLYVFVAAYLVEHREAFPKVALVIFLFANLSFVIAYYVIPARHFHIYFVGLVVEYVAAIMMVYSWSVRKQSVSAA
jgi:hypothetical protein